MKIKSIFIVRLIQVIMTLTIRIQRKTKIKQDFIAITPCVMHIKRGIFKTKLFTIFRECCFDHNTKLNISFNLQVI